MSKLTDRISYLKGLAEGLKLNADKDSNRMILEILDVLQETAQDLSQLTEAHNELNDYVESIDDDLAELEEDLFDDDDEYYEDDDDDDDDGYEFGDAEDDDKCSCGCGGHHHDDEDEDEDDDEGDDEDEVITYACHHCNHELQFKASDVDFDEDYRCPACGKPVFPELTEDDE